MDKYGYTYKKRWTSSDLRSSHGIWLISMSLGLVGFDDFFGESFVLRSFHCQMRSIYIYIYLNILHVYIRICICLNTNMHIKMCINIYIYIIIYMSDMYIFKCTNDLYNFYTYIYITYNMFIYTHWNNVTLYIYIYIVSISVWFPICWVQNDIQKRSTISQGWPWNWLTFSLAVWLYIKMISKW